MAQKISNKPSIGFSPRGLLLFVIPMPVLLAALRSLGKGEFFGFAANAGCFALFMLAAALTRRGLVEEKEYHRRKVARPPKPFKTAAAALFAIATGLTAWWGVGYSLIISVCFGLVSLLAYYLTYGFDPRAEKVTVARPGVTTEEVESAIKSAEQTILAIETASRDIGNRELKSRLSRICDQARSVLSVVEEDPRDLRRARKFLTVYLEGAQRVTEGYARSHTKGMSSELDENFRRVLTTIEEVFAEQHAKLMENDFFDLDVQIEVLQTQLEREGVV